MNFDYDFDYEKLEQIKNLILVLLISIDLIFIVTITFFDLPENDLKFMAYFDLFVCKKPVHKLLHLLTAAVCFLRAQKAAV